MVDASRSQNSIGLRVAWYAAAAGIAVLAFFTWWFIWQGVVGLLPEAFFELSDTQLNAFAIVGGLLLWVVLAVLMGAVFRLAAGRWPVPVQVWVAVAATGLVIAGMWLATVADVQRGTAAVADFIRLGLIPLIAMSAAAYIGTRRGSALRVARAPGLSNKGIQQNAKN